MTGMLCFMASFAARHQAAEYDALTGPHASGLPARRAEQKALISYVLGDGWCGFAVCSDVTFAAPPALSGLVSDASSAAPAPFGPTSTPVAVGAAPSLNSIASFSLR